MKNGAWISAPLAREFEDGGTDAFRIFQSPECWVDRFGMSGVVSAKSQAEAERVVEEMPADWKPERIFFRELVKQSSGIGSFRLLRGDPNSPLVETIREAGLVFEVNFGTGYNTGFFADQRLNREFLRERHPALVLNTFAHTCSFSVAAAVAGAKTTNVDSSKAFLARGRRNFSLNEISEEGHRFVADDALGYMRRAARRGGKFDAIILDPPTFGRGAGGKTFRFERDFSELLLAAADLAAESCALLISTNAAGWNARRLMDEAGAVLPSRVRFHPLPPPPDFSLHPPSCTVWALL
jgi:23S rRNA (cytosine1962-C5)-methyltransferase